jgi:hypothetical protein
LDQKTQNLKSLEKKYFCAKIKSDTVCSGDRKDTWTAHETQADENKIPIEGGESMGSSSVVFRTPAVCQTFVDKWNESCGIAMPLFVEERDAFQVQKEAGLGDNSLSFAEKIKNIDKHPKTAAHHNMMDEMRDVLKMTAKKEEGNEKMQKLMMMLMTDLLNGVKSEQTKDAFEEILLLNSDDPEFTSQVLQMMPKGYRRDARKSDKNKSE